MNKKFSIGKISNLYRGFFVLLLLGTSLLATPSAVMASSNLYSANLYNIANTDRTPQISSPDNSANGTTGPITGSSQPVCQGSFCWYYAGAEENYINAKGASASFTQGDPVVGPDDFHSLTEIALKSQDGQQVVEFGWSVAQEQFGDTLPHMFVYHWVNGESTCYNGCGYVPVGPTNPVGSPVTAGQAANYEIKYSKSEWQIIYNGNLIGYFPESIWDGSFTKAFTVQIFGEVSTPSGVVPDTQMGNAILGTQTGAAEVSSYKLYDSPEKLKLYPFLYGDPRSYEIANVTKNSFNYGGPGGY